MKDTFQKLSDKFKKSISSSSQQPVEEFEEEYVQLDTAPIEDGKTKINVRPFTIEDFSDIKLILDSLREGYTIALINIRPLKDKDLVELKRAINKLKKTCQAIEGDVAGFGEDWIVAVPSFAEIFRGHETTKIDD